MISSEKHFGDTSSMVSPQSWWVKKDRYDLSHNKLVKIKLNKKFQIISCQIFYKLSPWPKNGFQYGKLSAVILWKLLLFLSSAQALKVRWKEKGKLGAFPCQPFTSISAKKKMVWKCNCPAPLIIFCASKEWNLLLELLLLKHLTSLVPRWRCHHGTQGSWGLLHYFFMCASSCHAFLLTISSIGSWQTIFFQKNLYCLLLL